MEEKAIKGLTWTFLSYGGNRVLTFAATIVLARLLVPEDFGLLALATVTIGAFGLFRDLGLGGTLVLRQDLSKHDQGTILTLMMATGVILAVLISLLSPFAADVFSEPRLEKILPPLTVTIVLSSFTSFYSSLLQRELEFRRRFTLGIVQSLVYVPVAIVLAALGAGVWSLVIGQIAGSVGACLAVASLSSHYVRPRFDGSVAKDVLSTGSGFVAQGWLAFLEENADFLVVGRALGTQSLGFYSMAYRLGELPLRAIAGPVSQVTFPAFSRMRERGEDIQPAFTSSTRLVAIVTCPLGVILSATAEPFTLSVLGEQWEPMIGALGVLGLWAALRPVQFLFGWLLNSVGESRLLAAITAGVLVIFVPALIAAATFSDLTGVAWVAFGEIAVSLGITAYFARRRGYIQLHVQWRALRPIVIALPVCWVAARGLVGVAAEWPPGVVLVVASVGGAAVYGLTIWLVAPSIGADVLRQARRIVAGKAPTVQSPDT